MSAKDTAHQGCAASPNKQTPPLKRKENSSQGSCRLLRVKLRCRLTRLRFQGEEKKLPLSLPPSSAGQSPFWFGNINPIPFRSLALPKERFSNGVSLSLRLDSPVSKCCSHGTFLHFSLQSSHLNICYSHQDLHWRLFCRGSRPHGFHTLSMRKNLHARLLVALH